MGVIQDSINQGLSIAAFITTQSPTWKSKVESSQLKGENKKLENIKNKLNKEYDKNIKQKEEEIGIIKASENIATKEAYENEIKSLNENIKSNKEKLIELGDISTIKKNINENIPNRALDIEKEYASNLGTLHKFLAMDMNPSDTAKNKANKALKDAQKQKRNKNMKKVDKALNIETYADIYDKNKGAK